MNTAGCPACGAPVTFRFANSVQTVCEYCRSVIVRHDVDLERVGLERVGLERVGEVAAIPDDPSPVQIGTEGVFRDKAFEVAGRITYQYDLGGWNEWHIVFSDGASGWLSDSQLEYAITFAAPNAGTLPVRGSTQPGEKFNWQGTRYEVTTTTLARYGGVEGELPFQYWDKNAVWFLDLRSSDARFATIDYSEEPPLLFLGEAVEFESLRLKNLREFEGWPR